MSKFSPVILIIFAISVFFLVIDPAKKEIDQLKIEKEKNVEVLKSATTLKEKLEELQTKYNEISSEDQKKLSKILPDHVDNVRLIQEIDKIAEKNLVVLTGLSIDDNERKDSQENQQAEQNNDGKNYGKIGISFGVTTDYITFKDFMAELEESMRLVDISKFSVSAKEGNYYDFSVEINTYWLK